MRLGLPEILLILVMLLLFFGPSKLPALGASIGEAIKGFKKGIQSIDDDKPAQAAAPAQPAAPAKAPPSAQA
jgi:sec-independent protein translocase protein TatA